MFAKHHISYAPSNGIQRKISFHYMDGIHFEDDDAQRKSVQRRSKDHELIIVASLIDTHFDHQSVYM